MTAVPSVWHTLLPKFDDALQATTGSHYPQDEETILKFITVFEDHDSMSASYLPGLCDLREVDFALFVWCYDLEVDVRALSRSVGSKPQSRRSTLANTRLVLNERSAYATSAQESGEAHG